MADPLRQPDRPTVSLAPGIGLAQGRMHECCGPARHSFAMWVAGCIKGPVLWIQPAWHPHQLNPQAMIGFADPARFLFANAPKAEDLLWCAEEALRAGSAPLVVVDLPAPPPLTPVRRMHLAAEGCASKDAAPPLGLMLTPEDGGAPGVESRWFMAGQATPTGHNSGQNSGSHSGQHSGGPQGTPELRHWRLERRRARAQPVRHWLIRQDRTNAPLRVEGSAGPDHAGSQTGNPPPHMHKSC